MLLRRITAALACAALVALGAGTPEAQERVRVTGWVQWIGGQRLQVWTGGSTFNVDLREVGQSSYQSLRHGDRVVVDGVVSPDRNRVIARNIWLIPVEGSEAP
jgi:hypothetical protein